MDDTTLTRSGNDGFSYANAGGARRARVPSSVWDLPGGNRKMNRSEIGVSGTSGTNDCPESTMASTWAAHDLITGVLYFSKTTSLKA